VLLTFAVARIAVCAAGLLFHVIVFSSHDVFVTLCASTAMDGVWVLFNLPFTLKIAEDTFVLIVEISNFKKVSKLLFGDEFV